MRMKNMVFFSFLFSIKDFALDDEPLTLGADMDTSMSNEMYVADGRPLTLTVK
jgi:hypothetical protein